MLDKAVNLDTSSHQSSDGKARLSDELIFLLTNRLPRRWATQLVGWISHSRNPFVCSLALATWRLFDDIDLTDASKQHFDSVHDLFTRELRSGARPIDADPSVLASPCDAIVGACGRIDAGAMLQAKGLDYRLSELIADPVAAQRYEGGCFATLRLKSSMYHRFHAPHACTVQRVTYISGDTWNVNPISVQRIERLFCRNERAVIRAHLATGDEIMLVPVAAILVASIRLHFLDVLLHLKYRGPNEIACEAAFAKGQEMGWFEHGSTIIVLAPRGFSLCSGIEPGRRIRVGVGLMRRTRHGAS